jgi:hypothetical protein
LDAARIGRIQTWLAIRISKPDLKAAFEAVMVEAKTRPDMEVAAVDAVLAAKALTREKL